MPNGTVPTKLFPEISNRRNEDMDPRDCMLDNTKGVVLLLDDVPCKQCSKQEGQATVHTSGSSPVKLLSAKASVVNSTKLPIPFGMVPCKLPALMSSICKT